MADRFPGLRPYAKQLEELVGGIRDLPLSQLARLDAEIASVTYTNCAWSVFEVAKIIAPEVRWALRRAMDETATASPTPAQQEGTKQ